MIRNRAVTAAHRDGIARPWADLHVCAEGFERATSGGPGHTPAPPAPSDAVAATCHARVCEAALPKERGRQGDGGQSLPGAVASGLP